MQAMHGNSEPGILYTAVKSPSLLYVSTYSRCLSLGLARDPLGFKIFEYSLCPCLKGSLPPHLFSPLEYQD